MAGSSGFSSIVLSVPEDFDLSLLSALQAEVEKAGMAMTRIGSDAYAIRRVERHVDMVAADPTWMSARNGRATGERA